MSANSYFGNRVHCPHPKCDHVGHMITKVHCRMYHKMEREKLFKKYGDPKPVQMNAIRVRKNAPKWN